MQQKKGLAWVLLILLSLIWGSSFILMKRGLEAFSSSQVAALRICIAFFSLFPFLFFHYKINLKQYWKPLLAMGVFGNFIPAFLFTLAETGISSSLAGMLNALTPLFTVLIGIIVYRNKTGVYQVSGILMGLAGAIFLLSFAENKGNNNFKYALLIVLATLSYAISVNTIRRYLGGINSITAAVWAFTFIGPVALLYLMCTPVFTVLSENPKAFSSLGYIALLGILGTALSVILFNVLVKLSDAVFASSCTYLIPIVAILWGMAEGESVNLWQLVAIVIILGSIWLINRKKS